MRERFSSPILQKPVYTFSFDRFKPLDFQVRVQIDNPFSSKYPFFNFGQYLGCFWLKQKVEDHLANKDNLHNDNDNISYIIIKFDFDRLKFGFPGTQTTAFSQR